MALLYCTGVRFGVGRVGVGARVGIGVNCCSSCVMAWLSLLLLLIVVKIIRLRVRYIAFADVLRCRRLFRARGTYNMMIYIRVSRIIDDKSRYLWQKPLLLAIPQSFVRTGNRNRSSWKVAPSQSVNQSITTRMVEREINPCHTHVL